MKIFICVSVLILVGIYGVTDGAHAQDLFQEVASGNASESCSWTEEYSSGQTGSCNIASETVNTVDPGNLASASVATATSDDSGGQLYSGESRNAAVDSSVAPATTSDFARANAEVTAPAPEHVAEPPPATSGSPGIPASHVTPHESHSTSSAPDAPEQTTETATGSALPANAALDADGAPCVIAGQDSPADVSQLSHADPQPVPQPDGLDELRSLLGQARQAVSLLEAAVARQEHRLTLLAAAAATAAASTSTAPAPSGNAAVDLLSTLLRGFGMEPNEVSAATHYALRETLAQVLRERDGRTAGAAGGPGPGSYPTPASGHSITGAHRGFVGGGTAGPVDSRDWFARHFALRSATRVAPPLPLQADTPAAVAGAFAPPPASITCAFPYELPHPNIAASGGGPLLYIAAGDAAGSLYLLSPLDGSVLASVPTGTDSPVTACSAFYVRKLESTVVTGHADGQTRSFAVVLQEQQQASQPQPAPPQQQQQGEQPSSREGHGRAVQEEPAPLSKQRRSAAGGFASVVVQYLGLKHVVPSMPPGALPWAAVEELIASTGGAGAATEGGSHGAGGNGGNAGAGSAAAAAAAAAATAADAGYTGPPAPIMHILPYRLGNKAGGRRHVLVLDRAGNMRLDRENGTVRFWARTNRTQLAVHFVGTYAVMLSAFHSTVLNTLQPRQPRAYACQHLNGSRLVAASFDGYRPFRGYGINARAELLALVTPHEGGLTACKAHRATPLPWLDPDLLASCPQSVAMTPMRGYLIVSYGPHRVVLNVTGTIRHGIAAVAATTDEHLAVVAGPIASPSPPPTPAPAAADSETGALQPPPGLSAWAASGGLINGVMAPPPVVAVSPGNQLVVLGVIPPPQPLLASSSAVTAARSGTPQSGQQQQHQEPASVAEDSTAALVQGQLGTLGGAGVGAASPGAVDAGAAVDGSGGGAAAGAAGSLPLLLVLDSRMPRMAPPGSGSKIWTQPLFIGAMILVGLYQFWRMTSNRTQRRTMGAGPRVSRRSRGYGGYGGGGGYGDPYGEGRGSMPPRSALRRTKMERPMGRTVTYADDDDY